MSWWIWELVPIFQRLQFPERWLILFAPGVAYLASYSSSCMKPRLRVATGVAISVLFLLTSRQIATYQPDDDVSNSLVTAGIVSRGMVANWNQEYRTHWRKSIPDWPADRATLRGESVDRCDAAEATSFSHSTLRIISNREGRVTSDRAYWPSWRVEIDGSLVETFPSTPYGLLEFSVPKGESTVTIRLGKTRAERLAEIVSIAVLAALLGTMALRRRRRVREVNSPS